ncbi:MAG: EAL domain-containing protein [Candidatus Omnitrophica bacterium]|jgi:diguanylate cyclase (GGDEF)-like protein|nr:EAL domain-containing protein [Candidatus Omnitrophota bacterium]
MDLHKINIFEKDILDKIVVGASVIKYPQGAIEYANQAMLNMFKVSSVDEMIKHQIKDFYPDEATFLHMDVLIKKIFQDGFGFRKDIAYRLLNGKIIYTDVYGQLFDSSETDNTFRIIWTYIDVTENYILNETLEKQAFTDKLTNLPNRRALDREIEKAMARSIRHNKLLGVIIIDLDEFKPINDNYGHQSGDIVLQTVAKRMQDSIRRTDFISRLGGDEFVILLEDCASMEDIKIVLNRIEKTIQTPIILKNKEITVNLSAGICLYPLIGDVSYEILIRYADQALYESKEHKHDRLNFWFVYGEPISVQVNYIQNLLNEKRIKNFYQPIIDIHSQRIVGIEALARIQDKNGHILLPSKFLPYLHLYNIFDLSKQVLLQSIQDIAKIKDSGFNLWVSVNIDFASLSIRRLQYLKEALNENNINTSSIVLEIKENKNFIEQKEVLEHLLDLKSLGILLALDDVERTNASLLELKNLPFDQIKLDQNFVRTLKDDPSGINFIETILDISATLGTTMIVKGVENRDILDAMIVLNVPLLQGYSIGMPMPLDKLLTFLKSSKILKKNEIHPNSLLGLYAKHLEYNKFLSKEIKINPQIISTLDLGNEQKCPVYKDINRLKIDKKSLIYRLHKDYHKYLDKIKNSLIDAQISNEDFNNLKNIHHNFLESISQQYIDKHKKK